MKNGFGHCQALCKKRNNYRDPSKPHHTMKSLPAFLLCAVIATHVSAQRIAGMSDLTPAQAAAATHIELTGAPSTRGDSDFRRLRDRCWQLQSLDLGGADCPVIPDNAFHSRHRLHEVRFPANLRHIGTQAFFACDSLHAVSLPATVEHIGERAFARCTALGEVTLEGNPEIGAFAFAGCTGLRRLALRTATPPQAASTAFHGLDFSQCMLVVPAQAEEAYRRAEGWSAFFGQTAAPPRLCRPADCLIPVPERLEVDFAATPLPVRKGWDVRSDNGLENEAAHAHRILEERTGRKSDTRRAAALLELKLNDRLPDEEGYTLDVTPGGVRIEGRTAAGVFYGLTTFEQLLAGRTETNCCDALPTLRIEDAPRTRIRELMIDPVRTFIPYEELKKFVPEMARYKLNSLHLHLVDDQAWRIEIKHYPQLTEAGSVRASMDDMQVPSAGFYTQEQMKELVAYAARYHVQVIPEIEMPGHEVAAIHCYPQLTCGGREVPLRTTCGVSDELLCPGEDFVYEFLGNVFDELAEVFPCKYVHLGGDEAGNPALGCWTDCRKCQALKRKLDIQATGRKENWRLQKYMFDRVIDTLRTKHGKTPMFWYETDFKDIQPGCVVFAWRHGLTDAAIDAAIRNDARIVLCPGEHCYLDYPMQAGDMPERNWGMPVTPLEKTYALDPSWGRGTDFERTNLLGVAGTLWSECIDSPERIYYQAYPRALALAEAGWSRQERRSWPDFLRRIRPILEDMRRRGVSFSTRF